MTKNNNIINWIKKFLKRFLILLFFIIILANLLIILSGKTYLYKGIQETYLKGKSGPGIYDSLVFERRFINASENPSSWEKSAFEAAITDSLLQELDALETSSFLVAKNGEIIFEKYWDSHDVLMKSNSFSVAKSIVGLLIGIAIDKGYIKSFDEPITNYLDYFEPKDSVVTIRHLLNMTSGLDWTESSSNPLSENAAAYYGSNLEKLMRSLSFSRKSDKRFIYKSGNSQLLGFILEKATGQKISHFMQEHLWSKIGAESNAFWSLDQKDGVEKSFCCLYATTRDYAKLGQLILNDGKWNEDTVISSSTLNQIIDFSKINKGKKINYRYGLHYWLVNHPQHKIIYARGILGQYIITIPEKDIVIVRTGHKRKDKQQNLKGTNAYKNDHPDDLFLYLEIANALLSID